MFLERTARGVVVRAPAKVNLFLEVLGKRPDGYHELATLMVAVGLYDTLEFESDRTEAVQLEIVPAENQPARENLPPLSSGPDNLVCRAAELLLRHTGHKSGVRIRLRKRIPLAAGLAGGSSDAAATLAGLNALWRLGLRREELAALGARLGSDVAFFFATPAAWCTGRGEIVQPLTLGRPLHLVLVCPPVGLSTAEVFRNLTLPERPVDGRNLQQAAIRGDVETLGRLLHNRLQPVAERLCPVLADLKRRLAEAGPAGELMSGSGTTMFALCRDFGEAVRLAEHLLPLTRELPGSRVYCVQSCR
jgi:4-diphosphocytidyl-2-C-methyl-D-erythritol kinase